MEEEVRNPVSRRRILKRAGVGAAIVWSAPVLTSLGAAHAQNGTPVTSPCDDCGSDFCFGQTGCGPGGECLCSLQPDGSCYCGDLSGRTFCSEFVACDPFNDTCPAGSRCSPTCCFDALGTGVCLAPCGSTSPSGAGGQGTGATVRQ